MKKCKIIYKFSLEKLEIYKKEEKSITIAEVL